MKPLHPDAARYFTDPPPDDFAHDLADDDGLAEIDRLNDLEDLGMGSHVACPAAWADAACMIAHGEPMKDVAKYLACSRSTLWRTLQRSQRLRTRIAEERRYLALEAGTRFRGLHGAALQTIDAAVRGGDLRTAMWVADRLGLGKTDIAAAGRGIEDAASNTKYLGAPPVDPVVFTLDAPLTLEPEVDALLAADRKRWVGFPPEMDMTQMDMAQMDMAETDAAELDTAETDLPAGPAEEPADPFPPRRAVSGIPPLAARATFPEKCCTMLHGGAAGPSLDGASLAERLKAMLPKTHAAWPQAPVGLCHEGGRAFP